MNTTTMRTMNFTAAVFTLLAASLTLGAKGSPEPDFSAAFAVYDTDTLRADVYMPKDTAGVHYCVIFSYGGGFLQNNRKASFTRKFCRRLADDGYVAIASDYRLGLKGVKMHGVLSMVKPVREAVGMAAEDVLKLTAVVLDKAEEWKIKPDGIVLCGSSAGAITSLQCDYELCNRTPKTSVLPDDFRFAGVMSFAGAVFSDKGRCKYTVHEPAPTMLLHGKADKLVTYDKIAFFCIRLSGSNDLVKCFARNHWPYEIIRFVDEGHGVASRMNESYGEVSWFLDNMVKGGKHFEIDKTVYDRGHKRTSWDKAGTETLY